MLPVFQILTLLKLLILAISSCDFTVSTIFQWRFLGGNNNNGLMFMFTKNGGGLSIGRSLAGGLRDKTQKQLHLPTTQH